MKGIAYIPTYLQYWITMGNSLNRYGKIYGRNIAYT